MAPDDAGDERDASTHEEGPNQYGGDEGDVDAEDQTERIQDDG